MNKLMLTIPVSDDFLHLTLDWDDDVAKVTDIGHSHGFPTDAFIDYFILSKGSEYCLVAITPRGDKVFMCTRCLIMNNDAWVQVPSGALEVKDIIGIQLWKFKDYDWKRWDSKAVELVS